MSISYPDRSIAMLRTLVDTIDHELGSTTPTGELQSAWTQLVKVLALGPAPALRTCPYCEEVGLRAASRCGRCWSVLPPLDATS